MKKLLLLLIATLFLVGCNTTKSFKNETETGLLKQVQARGYLICGVNAGLPGFSAQDDAGNWSGLDVDFCKAVAAGIFGDASKVEFVGLNAAQRFPTLASGNIDYLQEIPLGQLVVMLT